MDDILRLVALLDRQASDLGLDASCVAVAWTLSMAGVTAAICGARRPEHVDGWIGAGTLNVPPQIMAELDFLSEH